MKSLIDQSNNMEATLEQPRKLKYYIHEPLDIAQLVSELGEKSRFEYDGTNDNITNAKLYIGRMSILDEVGVFADEDITLESNQELLLGYYAGEDGQAGKENKDSLYIFKIVNSSNQVIGLVDAQLKRNWTAFVNHSQTPNVKVEQKKVDGKRRICFYLISSVKKGDQLLFDYGLDYFDAPIVKFKPLYLHSSDGVQTAEEIYSSNKRYYASETLNFDRGICEDLGLVTSQWRIPQIFLLIVRNKINELYQLLQQSCPVDLIAYACDENGLLPTSHQQHITALMLACYLGRKEAIEALLKFGADVNRCMLHSGFTPLMLLLKGKAKDQDVAELACKILSTSYNLQIYDAQQLNALHYTIKRNSATLVKSLLEAAEQQNKDLFAQMFERKKELQPFFGLDYCLLKNQFPILELILNKIVNNNIHMQGKFLQYIKKRFIFGDETLKNATGDQLSKLNYLFSQKPFITRYKNTKLFETLNIGKRIADSMQDVSQSLNHNLPDVSLDEESINRLIEQARKLLDQEDYQTAMSILDNILKTDSLQLCALYLKGQVLEETEQFAEAVVFYDKALDICPNDANLLYNKAICLSWLPDSQSDEKALEVLMSIDPSFEDVEYQIFYHKVSIYIKNKQYEDALKVSNEALAIYQNDEKFLFGIAQSQFYLGNYFEALNICKQLEQEDPNNVNCLKNIAKCLIALNQYSEAAEVYKKVIELEPDNEDFKQALENTQNRLSQSHELLLAKGVLDLSCRRYKDAVEKLSKIKSTSVCYIDSLIYKGRALAKLKDYTQAISNFEQAFELDQGNTLVFLDIALSYHASHQYSQATKYYDLLLENKNKLQPEIVEAVGGDEKRRGYKEIAFKLTRPRARSKTKDDNTSTPMKEVSVTTETKDKAITKFFETTGKNNKRKQIPEEAVRDKNKRVKRK